MARKRFAFVLAIAVVALVLPLAAQASHEAGRCGSDGERALGIVPIGTGGAGSTTFYVDDRNFLLGNGLWLYQESNGVDNLQRGGASLLLSEAEICDEHHDAGPDLLYF